MRKQILISLLCGFLAFNLTACSFPFIGEKEYHGKEAVQVTRTPDQILYFMFDKMRNDLKTADYQAIVNVAATIDQEKLSMATKKKFNNKLLSLGVDRPHVLGIDNSEELAILTPLTIPNAKPILENEDSDIVDKVNSIDSMPSDNSSQPDFESSLYDNGPSLFDFGKNKVKVKLNYSIDGKFDYNDKESPKGESNLEMEVDMSGVIVRFDFESKIIDNNIYFKLGQLPPPFSMMVDTDFLDKWWSLNLEELKTEQNKEDSIFKEGLPPGLDFSLKVDEEKTKVLEAKIRKIIKKYKIFKVSEVLADENIEGNPCYHYKLELDRNIIRNELLEFFDLINAEMDDLFDVVVDSNQDNKEVLNRVTEAKKIINKEVKEQAKDFLGQVVKVIDDYKIDVWIDKDNSFLRKTKFDFILNLKNLDLNQLDEEIKEAVEAEVDGEVKYFNLNKETKIVVPIETESFFGYLNKALTNTKMKSRDARRVSDVKQIQTALELYYTDNNQYPDSLEDLSSGKTTYMRVLPKNPESSDGNCALISNYTYLVGTDKQNYKLKYCLGTSVARVPAGENIADNKRLFQKKDKEIIPLSQNNKNTDSDLDGLFDQEEIDIYKTDPNNSDTDGDGYLDGDEVKNGYNPAGGGSLSAALYGNDWSGYHTSEFLIKYPKKWSFKNEFEKISDEQKKASGIKVQFLSPYDSDSDVFRENVSLSVMDLSSTSYKTVDDWYNASRRIEEDSTKKVAVTKMTILGYPAIEEVYRESADEDSGLEILKVRKQYFVKDNKLYQLAFYAEYKGKEAVDYQIEAIKIMKSFSLKI